MAASSGLPSGTVSDVGEIELIRHFFADRTVSTTRHPLGIGDDCAVLEHDDDQYKLLVTTDLLVERIHFDRKNSTARDIGYKAVAVNFSDIAAMGGQPTNLFLSLALPGDTPLSWVDEFSNGLFDLCGNYQVPLSGGDTTGSGRDMVINLTVLGKVVEKNLKMRNGAVDGDVLCVTGTLGDSAAGLHLLKSREATNLSDRYRDHLIARHLRPRPALEEGHWLSNESGVHAMIDLSDGLATDAGHIAGNSQVGAVIDLDGIPVSDALQAFAGGKSTEESIELALFGGEDYHLLCAVGREEYEDVAERFRRHFGRPLYAVGRTTSSHQGIEYERNRNPVSVSGSGFNHFKLELHD